MERWKDGLCWIFERKKKVKEELVVVLFLFLLLCDSRNAILLRLRTNCLPGCYQLLPKRCLPKEEYRTVRGERDKDVKKE